MFFSLLGGPPKPEPEQVIKNYTEELKTALDEVRVTETTLLLVLFGNEGWLRRGRQPVPCWKVLPEEPLVSSREPSCPPGCWEGRSGFLWLTQPARPPSRLHLDLSLLSLASGLWHFSPI